jgi:F-box-like
MLPDDILLEILYFYVDEDVDEAIDEDSEPSQRQRIEAWITLAHVCRRWRSVIFQSPRRLNLRLLCTPNTPARDTLDIWPPLPLIIRNFGGIFYDGPRGADNIIAALEHNDRVCQVKLCDLSISQLKCVAAAMDEPFPELTDLRLDGSDAEPILPDSFLGGTAPRLRSLDLANVPFPGLPKLLLSATHLVNLNLDCIFDSDIPPEAMATSLSALTSLQSLRLHFLYPDLESQSPPPPLPPLTRSTLPSLTCISFEGASEYLEEILARIDAPRLDKLDVIFNNQIIFDTPQLFQFISRIPTLKALERGHIAFSFDTILVKFPSQPSDYRLFSARIRCTEEEWQLSSLKHVCSSSLPPLSTLEDLYIFEDRRYPPCWQDDVENRLWLELLHPFAAVKNLHLCEQIVPRLAPALQELVGARTTEVLPTLENMFLEGLQPSGPLQEGIGKFVAARQLTSHPVEVSRWDMDPEQYIVPFPTSIT